MDYLPTKVFLSWAGKRAAKIKGSLDPEVLELALPEFGYTIERRHLPFFGKHPSFTEVVCKIANKSRKIRPPPVVFDGFYGNLEKDWLIFPDMYFQGEDIRGEEKKELTMKNGMLCTAIKKAYILLPGLRITAPNGDVLDLPLYKGDDTPGDSFFKWAYAHGLAEDCAKIVPNLKKQAEEEERAEQNKLGMGICPVCFRSVAVLKNGGMVSHGYRIKRGGFTQGKLTQDCYGYTWEPWGKSPDGAKNYLNLLKETLRVREHQAATESLNEKQRDFVEKEIETLKMEMSFFDKAIRNWPKYPF